MIFDVKMNFTRNAWFVAQGYHMEPTPSDTYASVVYRDSVFVALLFSALNDVEVLRADIQG